MKWGRWKAWVLGDWEKERSSSIERDWGELRQKSQESYL